MNISNEEFHHKHLEYYRLFYAQESDDSYEPVKSPCVATTSSASDNNDTGHVSATQDWGEVVASGEITGNLGILYYNNIHLELEIRIKFIFNFQ